MLHAVDGGEASEERVAQEESLFIPVPAKLPGASARAPFAVPGAARFSSLADAPSARLPELA